MVILILIDLNLSYVQFIYNFKIVDYLQIQKNINILSIYVSIQTT